MTQELRWCACLGPAHGEPLCHCAMENAGLERSEEYYKAAEESRKKWAAFDWSILSKKENK